MRRETTTVAVRRTRFEPPAANALTVNPTSPMVLQGVMQILADLNRKVDALATRPPQEVTVSPAPSVPKAPVETASPADTTALAKTPAPRINRLRLRDIFD
jgi:hypothetical protein